MPDGRSPYLVGLEADHELRATEYEAMYRRLVDWGLCWLRAGESGIEPSTIIKIKIDGEDERIERVPYRDPDPDKRPRQWSRAEIDAAGRLHSRVIRLPRVVHRVVLQVFFAETVAAYWHEIEPNSRRGMVQDLTQWNGKPSGVNARLRVYNRECGASEPLIRPDHFEPILNRGVRLLCNNERVIP